MLEWRSRLRVRGVSGLSVLLLGETLLDALCRLPTPFGFYVRRTSLGVPPDRAKGLLPLPVRAFGELARKRHYTKEGVEGYRAWYTLVAYSLNFVGASFGKVGGQVCRQNGPTRSWSERCCV